VVSWSHHGILPEAGQPQGGGFAVRGELQCAMSDLLTA